MIEQIENRILKFKRNIDPRVLSLIFFCIFGFFTIFSMEMTNNFKRQKQLVQDEYNRSMYEMTSYIKNVDLQLYKVQLTSDKRLIIATLADIWRQSNLAKENLANLPILQDNMANTSKYLTQVSDFSHFLMDSVSRGKEITKEQYEDIAKLNTSSTELLIITNKIYDDLNTGRLKWDEVEKSGNENLDENVAVSNINSISETFVEYEGLIYDGAYSNHIIEITPKSLSEKVVTQEEAKANLINIFGEKNIEYVNFTGENNNRLELYGFQLKLKDNPNIRDIYMTKKDGKLYLMISDKKVEEQKITVDSAKDLGEDFLKKIGIDNVVDTYYIITENLVTINYAAVQNEIILYPDLVKVKIALDDGEICSVETGGYTFNHITRDNISPKLTIEEAQSKINKNIKIESKNLAIIPTESKKELLVYEFKGTVNEKKCILYINALTGEEENILMVIETPNGSLTM
ncbi:MAG: germination protein YpeB [Clostridia bacterium]|jgi:germination protein YpeB|nr:germination protein YpeB [Clostridia bacterium]